MGDRALRVGVDAWNLPHDHRGIGRYVRALLAEFAGPLADRIELTLVVPEWPSLPHRGRYRAAAGGYDLRVRSRRGIARAGLDLLWFPFNGMSWMPPSAIPTVATLHDGSPSVSSRNAAAHARCIITDSALFAAELARELAIPAERLQPILLGVAPPSPPLIGAANRFLGESPFVLFVDDADPGNGLPDLAAAVARLQADDIDVALKVIGHNVSDADLAELYRACTVFAFPSRDERFALPVLEAMSYGAPVIASDGAGHREIGGDAARYFAAGDAVGLADELRIILTDDITTEDLRIRGHVRAAAMTWRRCAEQTLAAFHRALE